MSTTEDVRALEREWIDAYLATDAERFAALLHDDFVYSSERGVFRKEEYVDNLRSGEIEMRGLENDEPNVIDLGDVAVSYGVSVLNASFRGRDISGRDRFTRVWQRAEDGWLAVALHANVVPDEEA